MEAPSPEFLGDVCSASRGLLRTCALRGPPRPAHQRSLHLRYKRLFFVLFLFFAYVSRGASLVWLSGVGWGGGEIWDGMGWDGS